ncbi:MAG TPA: glycosyltransferase, partial [Thermomicrobiales bacterium]|nr:glycosyltransferase [Thermomicrobiales bacterium]
AETRRILAETAEAHPNATLLPGAADGAGDALARALDTTRTAAVVLLDPRTLVTAGWLERLLAPLAADPTIGLVRPLSNAGGTGGVELPDGYGFADAAELIAARGRRRYPTARAVGGGCVLVRRDVLDRAGADGGGGRHPADGPDGIAAAWLAAAYALGLRAALADDCYVYRVGAPSDVGDDGLGYLRDAGTATLPAPPDLVYDAVYYLPPTAAGVGGMISVAEIVNRLILLGQRATVATVGPWQIDCECLFRPLCYAGEWEILAHPPVTKTLVATGHQTVDLVARVCAATGSAAAYFIQDYEGYFDHGAHMEAVAATYARIPHRIVVSRWVQGLLRERHDADSEVIPLGVAIDEFAPRGAPVPRLREARAAGRFLVFAMLRGDDRRGAPDLVAAARRLNERRPEVTFVFAGRYVDPEARLGGFPLPDLPNVIGVGLLDRAGMARHLASCDAALDASLYQGFGMLGVEALAAGTPAILTRTGGALEYAADGENCLLVEPGDVAGICDAIVRLRDDPALAARLAANGCVTARDYDWSGIAARHARFLAPLQAEAAGGVYRRFAGAYRAPRRVPAPPVAPPPARAIYRGARRRRHAYAAEPATLAFGGYRVEGVAFALYAEPAPGLAPFYHCIGKRGRHFYTADPDEARRAGYHPADVLGYVAEAERAGTRPLHRFFRRRRGDHLYGLDPEEGRTAGYRHEGVVGFVPEAPTAPPQPDEGESPAGS